MLAPGMVFSGGRVNISAGAAKAADIVVQGIGRMNNGDLAIDTNAPSGSNFDRGFRLNTSGAIYGTTTPGGGTDIWIEGIRCTVAGQLIYEAAAATAYSNGNPQTSNGRFAVN